VNWFGDSWDAPMNDPAAQADNQNRHVSYSCVDRTSDHRKRLGTTPQ
jgi:hypothetical protein